MDDFDVLVIGGGQAGVPLVYALADAGWRVALAERKQLGGSCVNFGCTPTKAAIASARVARLARRGAEFGLRIPTVEVDFEAVMDGARAVARESRQGLEEGLAGSTNPVLIRGHARFEGRADGGGFRVRSGDDRVVTARVVVLDTGTRALIPPIAGIEEIPYLTADSWIEGRTLPERLILLGGGFIGLEMGQFYQRVGSAVTIVNSGPMLPHEEPEVAKALRPLLEAEGIRFVLDATATQVTRSADGEVRLTVERDGATEEIVGSDLFVATGRKPNTGDLGLETIGVAVDDHGIVTADKRLSSSVPGVWVAGDIRGGPMFTHTAWDDYRILLSQMAGDGARTTDRLVPYAMFTDPELGRVGVTEAEARAAGTAVKVGFFEMRHNGRARETRETNGFAKVIVNAATDRMIGATVVSDQAGELVQIYATLMNADAPYMCIRDTVYIHPTFGEAIQSATEAVR